MATQIIRRHSDYAIRALLFLSGCEETITPCGEIAKACAISKSFAYKILRKLSRAGLTRSFPGRPGGFLLAKKPQDISLYDVIQVMQGSTLVSECVVTPACCGRSEGCIVSEKWHVLHQMMIEFLSSTSLGNILNAMAHTRLIQSVQDGDQSDLSPDPKTV